MTTQHLITIPFSHYAEKSRWMLDHAQESYEEIGRLPLYHMNETVKRGGRSVPMLVQEDGHVLRDSLDITSMLDAKHPELNFYPKAPELRAQARAFEVMLGERLGPPIRLAFYATILPEFDTYRAYFASQGSALDQKTFKFTWRVWLAALNKAMKPSKGRFERNIIRIKEVLDEIGEVLERSPHPYLFDSTPGAADITLAALASPLVGPDEHTHSIMAVDESPLAWQELVKHVRVHPVGEFVQHMYTQHRR